MWFGNLKTALDKLSDMLEPWRISHFYINSKLKVPNLWNLSRKHIRIQAVDGRFVKINKFGNRLNERELRESCIRYSPLHVYFSVLNWLFPERVGKKYKGNYAVPLGSGEFVVDVDSYLLHRWHQHVRSPVWKVCPLCLEISKHLTEHACWQIEDYYSDIHVVFSARAFKGLQHLNISNPPVRLLQIIHQRLLRLVTTELVQKPY